MNAKILTRFTGTLLLIESVAFAVCFFVSLAYGDSDMSAFAVSFIISVTLGWLLRRYGDKTKVALTRHDSFVIVTFAWLASTFVGALPYILSGTLPTLTDAFFETMSGFTTTGSTVIDDIDSQPHGILFLEVCNQLGRRFGNCFVYSCNSSVKRNGGDKAFSQQR